MHIAVAKGLVNIMRIFLEKGGKPEKLTKVDFFHFLLQPNKVNQRK